MTQLFPNLAPAIEEALRASIERFGVIVPVVKDQNGNIIDGNNRARIADELGCGYPVEPRVVADETEALALAVTLNADRRQMTRDQRREVVKALREEGHSQRAIAGAVGTSKRTVAKDLAEVGTGTHLDDGDDTEPDRVTGTDGKSYAARKKRPPNANNPTGRRHDRMAVYFPDTPGKKNIANGQKGRLVVGLSEISGLCRGLSDLDYGQTVSVCTTEELKSFGRVAKDATAVIGRTIRLLEEVSRNGSA